MGIGTAFASSTININNTNTVTMGQGVANVVSCQSDSLHVTPNSGLFTEVQPPTFYLDQIVISNVNYDSYLAESPGCGGKDFRVRTWQKYGDGVTEIPCSGYVSQVLKGDGITAVPYTCTGTNQLVFHVLQDTGSYIIKYAPNTISPDVFDYLTIESGEFKSEYGFSSGYWNTYDAWLLS
jgi:hypothetical protein